MTKPRRSDEQIVELAASGATNRQIAEMIGVTVRTLDRDRAKRPALNAAMNAARAELAAARRHGHGTPACYARGCRCRPCIDANSDRCYQDRARQRERAGLPDPTRAGRRPRGIPSTPRQTPYPRITPRTLGEAIEQAIARGEPTLTTMKRLGCDYATVKGVRDCMDELVASCSNAERRRNTERAA